MKRMLINATQPEELRVAIADGQSLLDLDIEVPAQEQKKSNIYKGRITRVEPSLDACFVEFGSERHGFLSLKEISREYFSEEAQKQLDSGTRVEIKDAVKAGQEVIIQVDKEERGTKGAALTTFISLAGRYLVLMPNNPRAGGVSRQIARDDRKELLDTLKKVDVPDGMGLIVRTAGVGREQEDLQWDLDYLVQLWNAINEAARSRSAPFLIYQESNLIIRALRDYLRDDIGEILIDDDKVFEDAREFMQQVMPHNLRKLKTYRDPIPLFSRYQIESQIESAFAREVRLPAGGALVIDHTEALLSIDINSARATKGADIEETALQTNLEAADEIARQLRIRDLGGLVVIDFIDMMSKDAQRQVENRLREAMRMDKARVQIGRISRFGLLEMSRQRLRPSLGESSYITCPRCDGHGSIRSVESLALAVLRLAEEEAMKDHTARVIVKAPITVANFLLNEKRVSLNEIEERNKVPLTVVSVPSLETPRFEVQRLKSSENVDEPSYALARDEDSDAHTDLVRSDTAPPPKPAAQAAVSTLRPSKPAPTREQEPESAEGGFVKWLKNLFGTSGDTAPASPSKPPAQSRPEERKADAGSRTNQRNSQQPSGAPSSSSSDGPGQQGQGQRKKRKKKKKKKKSQRKPSEAQPQTQKGNDDGGSQPPSSPDDGGEQKPRKKRRRRGGKKRRAKRGGQDGSNQPTKDQQSGEQEKPKADSGAESSSGKPTRPSDPARSTGTSDDSDRNSGQSRDQDPKSGGAAESPKQSRPESGDKPDAPDAPQRGKPPERGRKADSRPKPEPDQEAEPRQKPEPKEKSESAETAKPADKPDSDKKSESRERPKRDADGDSTSSGGQSGGDDKSARAVREDDGIYRLK
jgi:ribonuclease E